MRFFLRALEAPAQVASRHRYSNQAMPYVYLLHRIHKIRHRKGDKPGYRQPGHEIESGYQEKAFLSQLSQLLQVVQWIMVNELRYFGRNMVS